MSKGPSHVEGWLTKQPAVKGLFNSPRKRWFVFNDGEMSYWVSKGNSKKGAFSTRGMAFSSSQAERTFVLRAPEDRSRAWELTAGTQEDFQMWVTVLAEHGQLKAP